MLINKNFPSTMNLKNAPLPLELLVAERTLRLCSVSGAVNFYVLVWRGSMTTVMYDTFNNCIVNSNAREDDLANIEEDDLDNVREGNLEHLENFLYKHLTKV